MPLPTLRFPMASTSSLEFFGLTVSCCCTGLSCEACGFSDAGVVFAGSGAGGGLCANTVPAAKVASTPNRSALPRIAFMVSTFQSPVRLEYTPADCRWELVVLHLYDVVLLEKVSCSTMLGSVVFRESCALVGPWC